MNLKQLIIQKRSEQNIKQLKRIKIGKALFVFATLPICSAWAYLFAIPLMMPMKFSQWTKDKIKWYVTDRINLR